MKTIKINILKFDELNEEAKQKAIEQIRNQYYDNNDFAHWAVDDCSLFEPKQEEIEKLNLENYNFPIIENTRKNIYFDTGRSHFLDCSKAMNITDEEVFLKWLGVPESAIKLLNFEISTPNYRNADTRLELLPNDDQIEIEDFEKEHGFLFLDIETKFEDHINYILKRIENDINYRFTDKAIIEDIEANEIEFLEDGSISNF